MIYCIVPRELAPKLLEPLRRHFIHSLEVEVVVERRAAERRTESGRRNVQRGVGEAERRRIRHTAGRRVADRRVQTLAVEIAELPRKARAHQDRLVFIERLEPSQIEAEDRDTSRLVLRFQAGDEGVFNTLYMRYFDRVYSHLRIVLRDEHEAEDATQEVFVRVLKGLADYELRSAVPFRGWMFSIVRNYGHDLLVRRNRVQVEEPSKIEQRRECVDPASVDMSPLDWLTDRELVMLIERMPIAQRQVLVLRYMMQLRNTEIAEVLGRSPDSIRKLHERAMAFLHDRLTALGRTSGERRPGSTRISRQAIVLRRRRFALLPR